MKNRQDRSSLYKNLITRFGWVKSVGPYMGPHYPSSKEAYTVELSHLCKTIRDLPAERRKFDLYIKEYFDIPDWRNQVVTLWHEGHITVIVF